MPDQKNNSTPTVGAEHQRLVENDSRSSNWKRWGPYLPERQWGTVREDYSDNAESWTYFPFDQAASRVYRWGEDGLLGFTDRQCRLCISLSLWNGEDEILKERLFGLSGPEGNHGEDVKECYYYLDSTPTHSYNQSLYKYPQAAFPYQQLREENRKRDRLAREFELEDTGIFAESKYYDIFATYAKSAADDILVEFTIHNRGPEERLLHVLPNLWFRNTWIWGCKHEGCTMKPRIEQLSDGRLQCDHETLHRYYFEADKASDGTSFQWLLTENETNTQKLFGNPTYTDYVKDAFQEYILHGKKNAVAPNKRGTKAAAYYVLRIPAGGSKSIRLRLSSEEASQRQTYRTLWSDEFNQVLALRKAEADEFYAELLPEGYTPEELRIARQAHAGMLFNKQFYHYVVEDWLNGDPESPPPPESRKSGRNSDWTHLFNRDVISMPDKWEYPWYAAWDSAFHMIPFAKLDPTFAKEQLGMFLREWYMHPSGQLPAYEWALSDVNPPVHAWSVWRVYKMSAARGHRDRTFLSSCFQKLLINFTWWVNRKDTHRRHLFSGGFLGLDNIGLFDRSKPLPTGGYLEQADGTSWMAFFCSEMLAIAFELAQSDPAMEDMASKFLEHFVSITHAMNALGGTGLWDEEDGFYYDQLQLNGNSIPLKIRSMVGLIPLFATEILTESCLANAKDFGKRMAWFRRFKPELAQHLYFAKSSQDPTREGDCLLSAVPRARLERILKYLLDEEEFLSPYGVRSLSKVHRNKPFVFEHEGQVHQVAYVPGESDSGMFGGNSNWRGPVWFPVNFLLIEALERLHHFYGDDLKVECPTGSGQLHNLAEVAQEIARRLTRLFMPDEAGHRPFYGDEQPLYNHPHFRDLLLFHEYFDGDTGRGLGASHQTGWTGLVTNCLETLAHQRIDTLVPSSTPAIKKP
ncbi:MAG: MGH1-like glycoside hydrolase domain-containing protein [Planctomycetaceae bacterium]